MEKPICTMICEDCGKFGVMHENGITIFSVNNEFFAISRCIFCDRAVQDTANLEEIKYLFDLGVKVLDFNTGENITNKKDLGKI